MGQLQARNPQLANQIQQAMNNGVNPKSLIKQMMGNVDNSQMQNIMTQARNMGVPNDILAQMQNMR